jgi:seryl-tRNA synthetase
MLDIKTIRAQPEKIKKLCARRKSNVDIDELLRLDDELSAARRTIEDLRRERNAIAGPNAREEGVRLRDRISKLEADARTLEENRDAAWAFVPNLLAEDTPEGDDDSANVEVIRWGDPVKRDFPLKMHEEVGVDLGILDLKRGAKVATAGFSYWVGDGARLAHALFTLALDMLNKRKFIQMFPPVVARERAFFGTGYLPFAKDQIYRLENEDLSLVGTSEQTLAAFHMDEVLSSGQLPLLYSAYTPCFRTEAGSYGKASRGAFRMHQFHKVEQVVFCRPEESDAWLEHCRANEEAIMQMLEIPYRVVRVCVGDMGAPGYKKYDIEAWFAGFGGYRETHSNTNLLDYQARRLNIRCKDGGKTFVPHTISATMITDRALLAILENNQQEDGSVAIPAALRRDFGADRILLNQRS